MVSTTFEPKKNKRTDDSASLAGTGPVKVQFGCPLVMCAPLSERRKQTNTAAVGRRRGRIHTHSNRSLSATRYFTRVCVCVWACVYEIGKEVLYGSTTYHTSVTDHTHTHAHLDAPKRTGTEQYIVKVGISNGGKRSGNRKKERGSNTLSVKGRRVARPS